MNYHGRIMNMGHTAHLDADQKLVERDTRHAAAEIALEADAEIERFAAALAERDAVIAEAREAMAAIRDARRGSVYTDLTRADMREIAHEALARIDKRRRSWLT